MELKNKTVLVTGGTSGIGLELAKALAKQDNIVIVTGRNKEKIRRVQNISSKIIALESDVSNFDDVLRLRDLLTEKYPTLSVIFNNAGIMKKMQFDDIELSPQITAEIDVNLTGPIQVVEAFLPHLLKQEEAAIINTTSVLSYFPYAISPIYSATKSALSSFTKSLRLQLESTSVKIFEFSPPLTDTQLTKEFGEEDFSGVTAFSTKDIVSSVINGINKNRFEILPGNTRIVKTLSRVAPYLLVRSVRKQLKKIM